MKTAKYLENTSEWTEHPDRARKFGGAMDALFYCCKHQLRNVEIQGGDFRIPLPGNFGVDQADRLSE